MRRPYATRPFGMSRYYDVLIVGLDSNAMFQSGACYLFDCGTPDDFRCVFDSNDMFTSGALEINRHSFEMSRWSHQENHRNQLAGLSPENVYEAVANNRQSDVEDPRPKGRWFEMT